MRTTGNPFVECPSCKMDRQKLKAALSDYFPSEKLKINLILIGYDSGVIAILEKAENIDNFVLSRIKNNLIDDFGLSEENADWAARYWIDAYGREVLKKYVSLSPVTKAASKHELKEQRKVATPLTPRVQVNNNPIVVSKLKTHDKLPKSIIERDYNEEQRLGIQSLNFAIRVVFDLWNDCYTGLEITGEYEAYTQQSVIMLVMIYNDYDELIGFTSSLEIDAKCKVKKSFSMHVDVPHDEKIARITARWIPDPVSFNW